MTSEELAIYNEASSAAVNGSRRDLARALRCARRFETVHSARYGMVPFQEFIAWHCAYIGWPVRLRPNGRHT